MTDKTKTDARAVLESIRSEQFSDKVGAALLQAVYELEHAKQFEDDRSATEAALRKLIVDAVQEDGLST
ncbi:MAG: hypothetical protein LC808_10770 [Actinobacteria bacterium]|nr:hypothetical protein [Actinomycetota bacterium]